MKFKIIGKPISHSLSPLIHNYWFKKYNIKAEYLLSEISENDLPSLVKDIKSGKVKGANVTLPYKQKIIPLVDKVINEAKETNSINTIYLNEKKEVVGENTDVYGIQAAYLKEVINENHIAQNALIIGAGGVAPSIVLALMKSKVTSITIVNRTYEKSLFIKKRFSNVEVLKWTKICDVIKNYDIVFNATSLGLKNGDEFSLKFDDFKKSMKYIDTVYNPIETKMMKFFKNAGNKTYGGLDMLLYQAQKSFYLWTKINPEINDELINLLMNKLK